MKILNGYIFFRKLHDISELENSIDVCEISKDKTDLREKVRIAVIDDEEFAPLKTLRANKFDITYFDDIGDVNQVKEYPIVLVDLQGVGKLLEPSKQGAHIIAEIKKKFPDKFVIAYTGAGDPSLVAPAVELSDQYTIKDIGTQEWCEKLDYAIGKISNPSYTWRKFRNRLLESGVTPYELMILEDVYVRSIKNKNENYKADLDAAAEKLNLKNDARAVVQSVTGSAAFEIIKYIIFS